MREIYSILFIYVFVGVNCFAQNSFQSLEITEYQTINGEKLRFTSTILGKEKELFIGLPDGYNDSLKYPVILVLEGEVLFETFAPITRLMAQVNEIPPSIVVGIPFYNKHFEYAPKIAGVPESGQADKMLEHCRVELFPLLDSLYNCSQDKLIWAHSGLGGIFCTYLLLGADDQFDGILSSSPNLKFMKEYIETENAFELTAKKEKVFYYLTFGSNEAKEYMGSMFENVNNFAKKLENEAPDNLTWKYVVNENNNHFTNAVETYIDGLILYFKEKK